MDYTKKIEGDTIAIYERDRKEFWIQETAGEKHVEVYLGGQLKTAYVHEFSDELLALVSIGMNIILDFSEVTYMSSYFMKALLTVQQTMDRKDAVELKLVKLPDNIYEEFEKTGFSELLDIDRSTINEM